MSIKMEDVLHKRGKVKGDLMLYLDVNGVKRLLKDLSIDREGLNSYLGESMVINYKDRMNSSKEGSVICKLFRIFISEERIGFTFKIITRGNQTRLKSSCVIAFVSPCTSPSLTHLSLRLSLYFSLNVNLRARERARESEKECV